MVSPLIIPAFMDTSCVLRSLLHESQEAGVDAQNRKFEELHRTSRIYSDLTLLETPAALRAKYKGGLLSRSQHKRILSEWDKVESARITFLPISRDILILASGLVRESKIRGRLRSLDCIQFATFLEFRQRHSNAILFSADHSLCELAVEHSVPFFNPLSR